MIAYESLGPDGKVGDGMVLDEGVLLELVRPGTGEPVEPGAVGEVVVTTLTPEYPLIRFATGDLSAVLPGASPCGRTNLRIKGWLGRADQTTKVRGMFVHPEQIADVLRRHQSISPRPPRGRAGAKRRQMTLFIEIDASRPEDPARIAETLQALTKLRGTVQPAPRGSLPEDGKLIEDRRTLD